MAKSDALRRVLQDFRQAVGLLTRLPVSSSGAGAAADAQRGAQAAWAYPLAGLVVGALAALAGVAVLWLGLPEPLTALIALMVLTILCGALHEDGLADTADGLWGGWDRESRLRIMKDSHIGSYGVLALMFSVLARGGALWLLFQAGAGAATAGLVAAAVLSRAVMPALMYALPHARAEGLSHLVGRPGAPVAWTAFGLGAGVALVLLGWGCVWPVAGAALSAVVVGAVAKRKIGGQTGDILGAAQQVSEIVILLALAAQYTS